MKVIILAGGLGTRLAEETEIRPKPMIEIGGRPILWHIMKIYSHYGFQEFIVALGYKGEMIKRYFLDYMALSGNMTIHLKNGKVDYHQKKRDSWTIDLIDTGSDTMTGGRVKRLQPWIKETCMITYGDGVSNINILDLLHFHQSHGRLATVTAVRPPSRFGGIQIEGDMVTSFVEKPQIGEGWINGGFLVFEPEVLDYLKGDKSSLEADMLENLSNKKQLMVYRHHGFWQCMDTLRDKNLLQNLWNKKNAPWKIWD